MLVHLHPTKKMRLLSVFMRLMQIYFVLRMVLQRKTSGYIAIFLVYPLPWQWELEEHMISSRDGNSVRHNQCNAWVWNGSIGYIANHGAGNVCWHYLIS